MKLTQQQIDDYIMNPVYCPHCGSREILSNNDTDTDWDVADAWRNVKCSKCNSKWVECFQIWTIDNFEQGNVPTNNSSGH